MVQKNATFCTITIKDVEFRSWRTHATDKTTAPHRYSHI